MNVRDGFLSDIAEHPDDDAPRLIFADWLEDHGEEQFAEFIRLQCQLETLPELDARREDMEACAERLLLSHHKTWAGPMRQCCRRWHFRKGFVERVEVDSSTLLEQATRWLSLAPVREVHLFSPYRRGDRKVDRNLLRNLRGLIFTARNQTLELLDDFLPHCSPDTFRSLRVAPEFIGSVVPSLTSYPACRRLVNLDVTQTVLNSESLELLAGDAFPNLLRLTVRNPITGLFNRLTESLLGRLVQKLNYLDLTNSGMTTQVLTSLKTVRNASLQTLILDGNPVEPDGFIDMPLMEHLRVLSISACLRAPEMVKQLACCSRAGGLISLRLHHIILSSQGLVALSHSPHLRSLRHLSLRGWGLGFQKMVALGDGELLRNLTRLDLARNQLNVKALRVLMQSVALTNLYSLDLAFNALGDEGADVLLARGPWPRLVRLDLRDNGISTARKQQLRQVFGHRVRY